VDLDPDPCGPKTCGSGGFGTLVGKVESEGRQVKQCCTYLGVRIEVVLVPEEVLLVLRHLLGDEDGEAGHLPQAARPHVPAQPARGVQKFRFKGTVSREI
jgi:hypothetical protein